MNYLKQIRLKIYTVTSELMETLTDTMTLGRMLKVGHTNYVKGTQKQKEITFTKDMKQ